MVAPAHTCVGQARTITGRVTLKSDYDVLGPRPHDDADVVLQSAPKSFLNDGQGNFNCPPLRLCLDRTEIRPDDFRLALVIQSPAVQFRGKHLIQAVVIWRTAKASNHRENTDGATGVPLMLPRHV